MWKKDGWPLQHMHDTKNIRLWVVKTKWESGAKLCENKPFKASIAVVFDIMVSMLFHLKKGFVPKQSCCIMIPVSYLHSRYFS